MSVEALELVEHRSKSTPEADAVAYKKRYALWKRLPQLHAENLSAPERVGMALDMLKEGGLPPNPVNKNSPFYTVIGWRQGRNNGAAPVMSLAERKDAFLMNVVLPFQSRNTWNESGSYLIHKTTGAVRKIGGDLGQQPEELVRTFLPRHMEDHFTREEHRAFNRQETAEEKGWDKYPHYQALVLCEEFFDGVAVQPVEGQSAYTAMRQTTITHSHRSDFDTYHVVRQLGDMVEGEFLPHSTFLHIDGTDAIFHLRETEMKPLEQEGKVPPTEEETDRAFDRFVGALLAETTHLAL